MSIHSVELVIMLENISGHYVASVCSDQEWTMCNDTQILKSSESDSKSMECNICIYTKVFHSSTPFNPTDEWQNLKGRHAPGGLHYSFGLKGNYARNLNLGEEPRLKTQTFSNMDAHKPKSKKTPKFRKCVHK